MMIPSLAAAMLALHALALATGGAQQAEQAQQVEPDPRATAAVSGRVVSAKTGEPLRDANVQIVSYEVMRRPRSMRTDADGRFEFRDLLPGRYRIEANATGHLGLDFGQTQPSEAGRPIDLREREHFTGADFVLPGTSSLSGVISDEFGDPAPSIAVMVSTAAYVAGQRRMMPAGQAATTDDKGQFRIDDLAPGTYYVLAMTGAFAGPGAADTGGFAPTFFPGTTAAAQARSVVVGIGADVGGVSFAMTPGLTTNLAGRLVDETGAPVVNGSVVLFPSDRSETGVVMIARTVGGPDGSYAFRNVPPGEFTVQAFGRPVGGGNLGRAPFGFRTVTLEGEPVDDVTVEVPPGRAARGRITFEPDNAPRPEPGQVRVFPRATGFDSSPIAGGPPTTTVHEDWTFEVLNMNGWRVVRVDVASPTWHLKEVRLDGRDVTDTPLDFRQDDVNDIEIVLTTGLGSLNGTVTEADGAAALDYAVLIFPIESRHWAFPSRYLHLARPNQTGAFRAPGLPPADYLAVALPSVPAMGWEDPELLTSLRSVATRVLVGERAEATVTLQVVRRD